MHLSSTELKQEVVLTSINKMMRSDFFSICPLDRASEVLGIGIKGEAYSMLYALHCVHFKDMSPALRQSLPGLIAECFNRPDIFQFQMPSQRTLVAQTLVQNVVDVTVVDEVQAKTPNFFKRMLGKS